MRNVAPPPGIEQVLIAAGLAVAGIVLVVLLDRGGAEA
jgi:hypothetical protein